MIKNNLKISFRILKKDFTYSLINIVSLAFAFAIVLLIFEHARFEMSYENGYENAPMIARVTTDLLDNESVIEQDCEVYPPLPGRIVKEIPSAVASARAYQLEDIRSVEIDGKIYSEKDLYAADASIFELFNYEFISPKKADIFQNPYEIVITSSSAKKLFGATDVVGRLLKLPEVDHSFNIVGVIKDRPKNTHLKFSMLVSYPTMLAAQIERENNWGGNNTYAYILLSDENKHQQFALELKELNKKLKEEEKIDNEKFITQPIEDIHLYSSKSFEPEINGSASEVYFLLLVAGLVLLIAFVNYVNLSTSKSLDRAKEIGIRKVMGSTRTQISLQIFSESILIHVFAGIGTVFILLALLPSFKELTELPVDYNPFLSTIFWIELTAIISLSALISGILPASILSSFKPKAVLKGKIGHSKSGIALRKSLIVLQFGITIVLLIQAATVREQIQYLKDMDLGANIDQVISIRGPEIDSVRTKFKAFKNNLSTQSWVKSIALSSAVPGLPVNEMSTTTGVNLEGAKIRNSFNYYLYRIDENYIPTMEMKLLAGQNFEKTQQNDRNVIINEETAKLLGAKSPEELVDKKLDFWGEKWRIMGVLQNFHQTSPKSPHIPLVLRYSDYFSLASVRINDQNMQEKMASLASIYDQYFSGLPFDYFFVNQTYERQFRKDEQFQKAFGILTLFAVMIACLGLYGLATFTILKRSKEIGIRKVLGAGVSQIVVLLSREFISLVLLAAAISIPFAYYVVYGWLDGFSERITLSWYFFLVPIALVILVALASISYKTVEVSLKNPVDSLKEE